ncbi:MAG TPA: PEP/pyruvate-binding domain-containing protein [Enhygromyxa sp.]|nr:PEP/pyruvate-binding domain-containing protein [Enhygromyxa sp.]
MIHPIAAIESTEQVGGKAATLARLHALGVPVPEAVVLGCEHFERFVRDNRLDATFAELSLDLAAPASFTAAAEVMRRAVERAAVPSATLAELSAIGPAAGPSPWIVRSSAIGEDSEHASFAGQLDSLLDVRSAAALEQALRRCWGSYWSARVLFYQRARGCRLQGMGVIVQRMIDAAMGGVLFTRSPTEGEALAIEYVHGHPGELVAGAVEPERLTVARGSRPSAAPFAELVEIGLALERALGGPQDIEWLVDRADKLWIVQSRPITRGPARQLFSNVNVNENYPRPISPLLYSIASDAYQSYFANLGRQLGVREAALERVEQPLRHCVGAVGGRLYYNLTNIHRAIAAAPFAAQLGAAFDGFVGLDDEGGPAAGQTPTPRSRVRWRDAARVAGAALRSLASLDRRVAAFEARVDAYVARTEALEDMSIEQLLARFHEFLDLRFRRWTDASLADLAATLGYAWLRWTLQRTLGADAARRLPQTLLLAIPELVSAGPIDALWQLSRIARADPPLREAFVRLAGDEPERLLAIIRADPRHREFHAAFDDYVRTHGFRVSGELLLTTESYVDRPAALLPVLAPYLDIEGPSPRERQATQAAARDRAIAGVDRRLTWAWRSLFHAALRATQRAIGYRERARLRQALLYSRFRAVVRQLGVELVARGRLRRSDDLLFASWREIDAWLTGHSMFPALFGEIVELRRREHARISATRPPDTVRLPVGDYLETPIDPREVGEPGTLAGVGVAGGRAIGVARVLEDLSQAGGFQRGDCLVARQTDPGWAPLFYLAGGLVMERGGMLSHGAIVARELGIPGVIAVPDAARILRSGERIEIDGDRGRVRRLARGEVDA